MTRITIFQPHPECPPDRLAEWLPDVDCGTVRLWEEPVPQASSWGDGAVVLGGTAITGGKGSLTGVMLGTLLIVIVQNSMILTGIPTIWQNFALGLLIIVGTGISAVQVARSRGRTA